MMPGLCATLLAPDKDRGLFVLFRIYKAFKPTQYVRHQASTDQLQSVKTSKKSESKKRVIIISNISQVPSSTVFSSLAPIYNQITIITIVIIIMRYCLVQAVKK